MKLPHYSGKGKYFLKQKVITGDKFDYFMHLDYVAIIAWQIPACTKD